MLKSLGERETCVFVCHRNRLVSSPIRTEYETFFFNYYLWEKRVTYQGPREPAGRELVDASFGLSALYHQTGKRLDLWVDAEGRLALWLSLAPLHPSQAFPQRPGCVC